jgi:hypothetical protein
MSFTDKQLEHAKAELLAARRMESPFPNVEALIARLEAAEACAAIYAEDYSSSPLTENWLRSKGA